MKKLDPTKTGFYYRKDQDAEIYPKDDCDAGPPCSSGSALNGNVEESPTSFSPRLPQERIPDETHLKAKSVVSRPITKEGKSARSKAYQQYAKM